ncbi:hypothetical protein OKW34_008813 [Paraburkholderia youngii]|uniref:hypothetical protein n=1 Tax=Paraburkholderia youngii TaxID=2782701 RepID=UPI003D1AE3C4
MSSIIETAEQRFRSALNRLKDGESQILPRGTPVSQNNVAKEAGCDPSALRKTRYPTLVGEIQAWLKIHDAAKTLQRKRQSKRREKEDLTMKLERVEKQRDLAQSRLVNADRKVLELLQENAQLQAQLDDLRPPATPLRK